jgi:hypothetical protein
MIKIGKLAPTTDIAGSIREQARSHNRHRSGADRRCGEEGLPDADNSAQQQEAGYVGPA